MSQQEDAYRAPSTQALSRDFLGLGTLLRLAHVSSETRGGVWDVKQALN